MPPTPLTGTPVMQNLDPQSSKTTLKMFLVGAVFVVAVFTDGATLPILRFAF